MATAARTLSIIIREDLLTLRLLKRPENTGIYARASGLKGSVGNLMNGYCSCAAMNMLLDSAPCSGKGELKFWSSMSSGTGRSSVITGNLDWGDAQWRDR